MIDAGMFREFVPKSYLYLRSGYKASTFKKDLLAGVTVGIIALPLAMAFAIASGTTPDRGLFTAIIAGFLISALGGSRVQIGGPTGAFVVIVYDIIQRTGYEGLAISTLIAALFLVLLGIFRIGSWIKYVPHPLVTGFTTGIAVIIFSTQIKDFFGLNMGVPPAPFIDKWMAYAAVSSSIHLPTFFLGAGTLALILAVRKYIPSIPWGIAAIVIATLVSYFFHLPVETIQTKFGDIPRHLPIPSLPSLHIPEGKLVEILMDAIAIAFLGGIESLLSAVIGDGMTGGRHKSNCELVAQGIANFGSILFGGIPATGAIARTAANVKTGAQTPVAGMIHALTLFLIILLLAPVVSQIPLAALAAVLMMVAWNMSEVSHFIRLLRAPAGDVAILLTAFIFTVFVDITVAISLGMILASFLFMKRMSQYSKTVQLTTLFQESKSEFPERSDPDAIANKKVPSGVEVYEIQGPFFFGAADMLKDILVNLERPPKVFILRMRHIPMIDASGMHALKEFYHKCHRAKTILLLSGIHGQTAKDLHKFGLTRLIGEAHIFPHIDAALAKAKECAES
ncbi:MAG TPA: sulfate permease [Chlamydiales bacterium]|nr:sulfate permease [Chlamydiales bacterium]